MRVENQKMIVLPTPNMSKTPSTSGDRESSSTKTISSHCSKCSHCHPSAKSPDVNLTTTQPYVHGIDEQSRNPQNHPLMYSQLLPTVKSHRPVYNPHHISHQFPTPPGRLHHYPSLSQIQMMSMGYHEPRLHPYAPAPVLHNLGRGPEPLFGWESVLPLKHSYGQPKYMKHVKPDYRRFCFSVGKADVPFAAMPGGSMWGMDVTMSPQMVGRHRW